MPPSVSEKNIETDPTQEIILEDYRIAFRSRQMSVLGRREVMRGRAKFGGFGDGKELPLVALARHFQPGDFRSGYYRDQTLMLALGELSVQSFFAQLYAHTDPAIETHSGGRQMPAHFATHLLDEHGNWLDLARRYNSSADISPTAAQMPRLVGLAYASRLFRELPDLKAFPQFSDDGNEVAFGVIGNASCAEGLFWESINAIGVLRAPAVISILDDAYGISVPNPIQFTKENLSELLVGFQRSDQGVGYQLYTVPGWDYAALVQVYAEAVQQARHDHIPALIHVTELTQPQGHSTSGSQERYKSEARLAWEREYDGIAQMRAWMLREEIAGEEQIERLEAEEEALVQAQVREEWDLYIQERRQEQGEVQRLVEEMAASSVHGEALRALVRQMLRAPVPDRKVFFETIFNALKITRAETMPARRALMQWRDTHEATYRRIFSSHVTSQSAHAPEHVRVVPPVYPPEPEQVNGFEILNRFFDHAFARDARVITFGEDVGHLGGVNQTMAGLQNKYGDLRVSDTGIREMTIVGQGIGLAQRGLRPIAEIQYLDYLLYALQIMSDDLATLHWRTAGRQKAPVIIRTRGHRLEGVWHAGSPMAAIIHLVRGMHVVVPRDMTRAAGFYNTLLQSDDPALVVEVLMGYRRKEPVPDNLADIALPLGVPEILREGRDVTLVTYGAMCEIALAAAASLAEVDVEVEVIDVQTLLPFDRPGIIGQSLQKTSRIVFVDEDVPGGTTAYMMQHVLENQDGYFRLDSPPRTLTAQPHRTAYGTDGAYFSKPNAEDIFTRVYAMMHEADPVRYPDFLGGGITG